MFKCEECGMVFDEPNIYKEKHGLDAPPYEIFSECPFCGGHFVEAEKCELCGEWNVPRELTMGVCDECIYGYKLYKRCKNVFDGETAEVKIDYLASVLLDERTINDILKRYLAERLNHADCTEAIEADKSWFAEMLVKKTKGDK